MVSNIALQHILGESYLAGQFSQMKRSLAEQFRQIKRSLAEQFRQIKRNLAEHLLPKNTFELIPFWGSLLGGTIPPNCFSHFDYWCDLKSGGAQVIVTVCWAE